MLTWEVRFQMMGVLISIEDLLASQWKIGQLFEDRSTGESIDKCFRLCSFTECIHSASILLPLKMV